MEITKHAHAAVVFEKDGTTIVVDPGAFTPNSAELVAAASAVLITHDHYDHIDDAAVEGVEVYGPADLIARLGRGTVLTEGDELTIAGFDIKVFGKTHAPIWGDMPGNDNVALLIDGTVYHPGDSYVVPGGAVDTLLVPTSGPWTKLGEAIDFVRAVNPRQSVQIHELMASEPGQAMAAQMLGAEGFGGVPFIRLAPGESLTV
ncbi:MBL fold metallo-hydrolase [Glaciihabitans sp. dw_435]|uniref:MBL fold metallo-hydrolase n=1 Tax=Glaciihabitans sp. dw_435 TaxID=2720081 RepID=UPI001BD5C7EC|nr:MBL fold metallo-hydrolase [Glaciihabitans sp. dw_435]